MKLIGNEMQVTAQMPGGTKYTILRGTTGLWWSEAFPSIEPQRHLRDFRRLVKIATQRKGGA